MPKDDDQLFVLYPTFGWKYLTKMLVTAFVTYGMFIGLYLALSQL